MILRRLVRLVDSRLGVAKPLRKALTKVFPDHWSFLLGEIALYSFIVLVVTGTFLALFFEPSLAETTYHGSYEPLNGEEVSAAYASTVALSYDVRFGLLMRQTHHWAANVFVAGIVVHMFRIFFTGAFRRPREINWIIGLTMMLLALLNGFTGYSLPDDLLSGIGLRIASGVLLSVPLVGDWMWMILFGGEFPAEVTEPRLFIAHVFVVPALLAVLIAVHLGILVKQKHTQYPGRGRTERNVVGPRLWPGYALRSLAFFAGTVALLLAMGGLFQINPVWMYGPYHPSRGYIPAQPDWYIGWLEGALRLFPPADVRVFGYLVPGLFVPGVVIPGVLFTVLYAWPFLEAWRTRDREYHHLLDRPRDHPVRMGIGVGLATFVAVMLLAGANDVIAQKLIISVETVRSVLQISIITLPWIAGLLAYLYAKALKVGGRPGILSVSGADLREALRSLRPRGGRGGGRRTGVDDTDEHRTDGTDQDRQADASTPVG